MAILKDVADKHGLDTSKVKALSDLFPFFEKVRKEEPDLAITLDDKLSTNGAYPQNFDSYCEEIATTVGGRSIP